MGMAQNRQPLARDEGLDVFSPGVEIISDAYHPRLGLGGCQPYSAAEG
jgi:hypothetical protein